MSSSSEEVIDPKTIDWGGNASPLRVSYGKMFMWFFLISDALTFSSLLVAYGFMRHKYSEIWPIPGDVYHHFPFLHGVHLPLYYVGLMTFILIMSSVTMVLAVEAGHRNDRRSVLIWMFWTIIGGLAFVGSQAWEWYNFIVGTETGAEREILRNGVWVKEVIHGANMHFNEYGLPVFANFFFF